MELPRFAVIRKRVAAIRGLTDRSQRSPAYPKVSRVQLPRHDTTGVEKTPDSIWHRCSWEGGRSNPVAELAATSKRLVSALPSDNLKPLWEMFESLRRRTLCNRLSCTDSRKMPTMPKPPNHVVQTAAKRVLQQLIACITPDSTETAIAQRATHLLSEAGYPDTWYFQCAL